MRDVVNGSLLEKMAKDMYHAMDKVLGLEKKINMAKEIKKDRPLVVRDIEEAEALRKLVKSGDVTITAVNGEDDKELDELLEKLNEEMDEMDEDIGGIGGKGKAMNSGDGLMVGDRQRYGMDDRPEFVDGQMVEVDLGYYDVNLPIVEGMVVGKTSAPSWDTWIIDFGEPLTNMGGTMVYSYRAMEVPHVAIMKS